MTATTEVPRHEIRIPEWALRLQRQRAHAGRALPRLDPACTALLVVDMQNGFVAPDAAMHIPYAPGIVPVINGLAGALRSTGATVCWLQTDFSGQEQAWSVWFRQRLRPETSAVVIGTLSAGHPGYALHEALDVQPGDLFSVKTRFSPFVAGSSDLDSVLRRRGIDTLVITGTVSNTCCESTARDAMMLNYRTVFVTDGNAARTDDEHNATLGNMLQVFAEVAAADDVAAACG